MEKIAIVGLSCLFPDAETPQDYWRNLVEQKDSRSEATADQMGVDADTFFAPKKGTLDKYYCLNGGYVRDFALDAEGLRLSADKIRGMDDLFQWSLYVAREALRDAGVIGDGIADDADWADKEDKNKVLGRTGVVLGNLSFPTQRSHELFAPLYREVLEGAVSEVLGHEFVLPAGVEVENADLDNLKIAGYPAAFVSKALGLGGANFALDAACASSLYAVKLAADYLLTGKADLMLAGAVSRADPFFINMGFSIFHAYPEGDVGSAPLNGASGGLFAGEGAGMFVLKRHSDALRDGDKVYAVISGIGLSNDGKGKFLLQPNPKGQVLAFERAYDAAGVQPGEIDYVECHATGTPVGDITELNSMETFFGRHGAAPLIGSAKSNFGHLLTAAGMAGMTKVILGMAQGMLPATINLDAPLVSKGGSVGGVDGIVTEGIEWPAQGAVKRAGVSAFGFGGTNAHLILEETMDDGRRTTDGGRGIADDADWADEEDQNRNLTQRDATSSHATRNTQQRLAIVGMDAFFGDADGLEAFGQVVYEGKDDFRPIPRGRWLGIENEPKILEKYGFADGRAPDGAYVDEFDMDFFHFKIPPNNDTPIPQQLLILKVADRALRDAGMEAGSNVAVIIGTGAELALHRFRGRVDLSWQVRQALDAAGIVMTAAQEAQLEKIAKDAVHERAEVNQYTSFIGNIMASRISALWDFSGPSFTLSAEENSTFKALEVAQMMLGAGEVDAVVVGAVDLAGGVENVLLNKGKVESGKWKAEERVGEGAGCVVLRRVEDVGDGERVYAVVENVGFLNAGGADDAGGRGKSGEWIADDADDADWADEEGLGLGLVEVFGVGDWEVSAEKLGLTKFVQSPHHPVTLSPTTAIGSVKENFGHTFAAAGIASLIKTAHCLYHRYLPAVPNWTGPESPAAWRDGGLFVPSASQPWLVDGRGADRRAAIVGFGTDGAVANVTLSGSAQPATGAHPFLQNSSLLLLPVGGDDEASLLAGLEELRCAVEAADDLRGLASDWFAEFAADQRFVVAIVGRNYAELAREIGMALKSVAGAMASGNEWKTPLGSYFTPRPVGQDAEIAFVYPGAFSAYPGLGRELFMLFPELHGAFGDVVENSADLVGDTTLFPRGTEPQSQMQEAIYTLQMMQDSITMLQAGATYSTLATTVLRDTFGVKADAAFGYSLGEMTMMFATGVWDASDNNSAALAQSPLFRDRLSGTHEAVREFWNIPDGTEKVWAIWLVKDSAEKVQTIIDKYDRVYLTHINTATEVVIAGFPADCQAVVDKLGCDAVEAPYSHVIHCEPMRSEYDSFVELNTVPVSHAPEAALLFAAGDGTKQVTSKTIAQLIADAVTRQVDFPALVERAYGNGSRIFVELGPRSACSWWIKDILADRPHVAVSFNRKSKSDQEGLVLMLAQLVSQGVAVDLSPLYKPLEEESTAKKLVRTVSLCQEPIRERINSAENRALFKDIKIVTPVVEKVAEPVLAGGLPPVPTFVKPVEIRPIATPVNNVPLAKKIEEPIKMSEPMDKIIMTTPSTVTPVNGHEDVQQRGEEAKGQSDGFVVEQLERLIESTQMASRVHADFLRMRGNGLEQIAALVNGNGSADAPIDDVDEAVVMTTAESRHSYSRAIEVQDGNRPNNYTTPDEIIWDQADLIQYAEGSIVPMFGEEFAVIDSYRRRVRLPMYPYLLVDRITKLKAETHVYEPSTMTTEYDIPFDAWYSTDGQIPWAVSVESGQCDLLLISYMGIDFQNKGDRVYRLLDCTLTFLDDMPLEGHTLRYDISINSFARNGDALLFFFSYNCYVGDKMVLKMRNGCAGFFTDAELEAGKGIIHTKKELEAKAALPKSYFSSPLTCDRRQFERDDLLALSNGNIAEVFGEAYRAHSWDAGRNKSLRLSSPAMLMIDRIAKIDPQGGAWGLGLIMSEIDIEADDWFFPCHFKDDEVMAGSLVAEGCSQLLQFYLLYLGMQTQTEDARFQPVKNLGQVVRTRKQIMAAKAKLIYRMEITEIGMEPQPYAKANVDIIYNEIVVVDFKNLGLQLTEKAADDPYRVNSEQLSVNSEEALNHPTLSPVPVADFRPRPALYDDWHIENFATGSISACFGPEYEIFEGKRIPRTPNTDLKLFNRIVEINCERGVFSGNPNLVSEYDVPVDSWYFEKNSSASTMPYSVLMEIALQPCGFLSAYLGSTLPYPDTDFFFRNLDGDGELLRDFDLRGKTISNHVTLTSSTAMPGIVIQKFTFAMSVNGELFYQGTAVFGYFEGKSLVSQVGLDQGKVYPSWLSESGAAGKTIDLTTRNTQHPSTSSGRGAIRDSQLNFLDDVTVVTNGGKLDKGYVFGRKTINPQDWFFTCHFYQDPVMPGSLGVEAMIEALEILSLEAGYGAGLTNPQFTHADNHKVTWIYRGQMAPDSGEMSLEVDVTAVERSGNQVFVKADASLWKNELRIYHVKDVALRIVGD